MEIEKKNMGPQVFKSRNIPETFWPSKAQGFLGSAHFFPPQPAELDHHLGLSCGDGANVPSSVPEAPRGRTGPPKKVTFFSILTDMTPVFFVGAEPDFGRISPNFELEFSSVAHWRRPGCRPAWAKSASRSFRAKVSRTARRM